MHSQIQMQMKYDQIRWKCAERVGARKKTESVERFRGVGAALSRKFRCTRRAVFGVSLWGGATPPTPITSPRRLDFQSVPLRRHLLDNSMSRFEQRVNDFVKTIPIVQLPRDDQDATYIQSFTHLEAENIKTFFDQYGFVVVRGAIEKNQIY
jgi:hypothetical protein